jgi:sodium/potassium-transporting ATPase subunit alpha
MYAIEPEDPSNLYLGERHTVPLNRQTTKHRLPNYLTTYLSLLGVLLFVVVVATCYETYSQEAKSDQLMEKFRALVPSSASVVRDGESVQIDASHIVRGDLIRLKSGDKVPADCRVVYNQSMKVDQSMITGESEPVDSGVSAADNNPLEARNIIYSGSLVVDGGCLAVVIRTGDDTLIGSMVELTGDVHKAASTLKADIEYFVILLTKFALAQVTLTYHTQYIPYTIPYSTYITYYCVHHSRRSSSSLSGPSEVWIWSRCLYKASS